MYPTANTNIQILIYFSCFIIYCFLENFNYFKAQKFRMKFFWGRFLIQGFFGGVSVGSPRDFFGFWFLPSFDHPCHLKSVVPWACYTASKFLSAACLLRPFWFVHVKWPLINGERFRITVPFKSKLTICCKSWFSTRFAIFDSCTNGDREQAIENRVEDQVPQDRKQKMHPPLIILQRPTAVTQHGMVIHVFAQATVCSKLEQFKL